MEGAADHIIDDEERRKTKEKIEGWRKLRQANEMEKKVWHMVESEIFLIVTNNNSY